MEELKWEQRYINIILNSSKDFFETRGYKLTNIIENSRDGCYVEYKKGFYTIYVNFCPTSDILICYSNNTLIGLIKFIFTGKSTKSFLSLRDKIKLHKNADEFKAYAIFIENGLNYIKKHNLLRKKNW